MERQAILRLRDGKEFTGTAFGAEGVIANATGARTLRFLPPLICEREDVDVLIAALQRVLG